MGGIQQARHTAWDCLSSGKTISQSKRCDIIRPYFRKGILGEELSAADHKVRKAVGEAEKGLFKLFKEIRPTYFDVKLNKLDKGKIMAARKKVTAFMSKFMTITKLQG